MALKGDFIGFTFDNKHSSELGIVRVSNGSRYNETLLPEFSNKTINVPGADRVDYLGMEYGQKPFPIEFAFDSITESQLRQLKHWFLSKEPRPLVFDETPYKTYYVKASSPPSISYICFDEDFNNNNVEKKRIYKGEGQINLVSFYPYGFADPNYLDNHNDTNKEEWREASGLKTGITGLTVYNPGDFDTPFKIFINGNSLPAGSMALGNEVLTWSAGAVENNENDVRICFNSANQLIEGYDANGKKTGTIYNKFITSGQWFKIPVGIEAKISITGLTNPQLEYKILYI